MFVDFVLCVMPVTISVCNHGLGLSDWLRPTSGHAVQRQWRLCLALMQTVEAETCFLIV
jgi:hypothetical protein